MVVGMTMCLASSIVYAAQGTATFYAPPYVREDTKLNCIGATNLEPQPCKDGYAIFTIVDYCRPPRCHATLNRSEVAFYFIANLTAGRVKIEYDG
ncbi:hypothetical protein FNV43_RR03291 [Rhamnella rubrinervis]|uniref:Uncharacterized protein n=1 Tax=Rhamnella rubrinervis TaxID=2594499 RepID=A0A8K0MP58_9ROSA|nr:hypothetical protein FNV43_RR03291 [Rhamnella rubrinervis]